MQPSRGDELTWLAASREHLTAVVDAGLPSRIRCFHAQRAAEMAMKAVLIHHGAEFPNTHVLVKLAELMPGTTPDLLTDAARLTPYAVQEMYPDTYTDLTAEHVDDAIRIAQAVVGWAANAIDTT